ncbi:MAG: trypsin-like peptidase domain-containing protein [Gammaproteobacteria bacterium]|nr:trypsin-like peptidase domain-containing protein [Gammaproteobacteria bacterium]
MSRIAGWLRWISPWVALGLAVALALVLLKRGTNGGDAAPPASAPPAQAVQAPAANPDPAAVQPPAPQPQFVSYADAVDRSAPAVVNIYTERRVLVPSVGRLPPEIGRLFGDVWPDYRERVERSLGSGVIYDARGHVVTNFHVIEKASQINVQLKDGREAPATLVGADPDTDLAVLKIDLAKLPVMPIGRSDRLRVGEPVLAIGNPIGLGQTVTQGIISATGRGRLGVSTYENFIQTDAPINFGNSGGALINATGELVGLNTAIAGRMLGIEGIGFAIPVDLVRGVVDAILRDGRVVRGWIGVVPRDVTEGEAEQFGIPVGSVLVRQVYDGSPANAQGVTRGDVITEVNGTRLRGAQDLMARVAMLKPGQGVRLSLWRGPPFEEPLREHNVRIEVVERPTQAAASPAA